MLSHCDTDGSSQLVYCNGCDADAIYNMRLFCQGCTCCFCPWFCFIHCADSRSLHTVTCVWFCMKRSVSRLLCLAFTPPSVVTPTLEINSEITWNIARCNDQHEPAHSLTHLLHLSLSSPMPFPSLPSSTSPHPLSLLLSSPFVPLFFSHFLLLSVYLLSSHLPALPLPFPSSFSRLSPNPSSPP